jgi:cytochrome c
MDIDNNFKVDSMTQSIRSVLVAAATGTAFLFLAPAANAFDEDAAKLLFKKNECTKCHAPEKNKKGPSLKKIAKEEKGKADAEATLIKHFTSGKKVKLDDGSEEEHKVIETKDQAELKNLAQWILSH